MLLRSQGSEAASLASSSMTPLLTGAGLGGSRCPYLDGLACGTLWFKRMSPARDLFWVEPSMCELQKHSKRSEESLTSFRRLEPAIHRSRMQDVFNASWEKSGADPPLRVGMSLNKAAIDPDYLRDMGFSLPGSVVDSALVASFDYVHTATHTQLRALMTWSMENRKYEPDILLILATFI